MPKGGAHFDLREAADLFRKAEYDLERFRGDPDSYAAFDAICTTNHIWDWATKDPTLPAGAQADADNLGHGQDHDVELVKLLCERAKHFERREAPRTEKRKAGWGEGRWGRMPWGGAEIQYLVDDGGTMRFVDVLLEAVLGKWEALFKRHGVI